MTRWSDWDSFRKSAPIRVKGGIQAESKKGAFGNSWWAKRWIAVLESFNLGGRLERGRSYARKGQVLSIEVQKGEVKAKVQGSRPSPYAVSIAVKQLPQTVWKKAVEALCKQPMLVAKLLAGEMPEQIEDVFAAASAPLFPESSRDLKTNCSCPDDSNPCKHIAAVYYLLGEEFDRDPFLIFRMRGLERKELVEMLGPVKRMQAEAEETTEPLPLDPVAFWQGRPLPEGVLGELQAPAITAAYVKRLGGFPFWRGERPFIDALEEIYGGASNRLRLLL